MSGRAWCSCGKFERQFDHSHCSSRLFTALDNLFTSEKGADVTFELPDGEVQAHKNIISARVDVFDKMFSTNMQESLTNKVKIVDSDVASFKAFLRFLYTGKLIEPFEPERVLVLAKKYDVPDLVYPCVPKIKEQLAAMASDEHCIDSLIKAVTPKLELAKEHDIPSVRYECESALLDKIGKIKSELDTMIVKGHFKYDHSLVSFLYPNTVTCKDQLMRGTVQLLILSHLQGGTRLRAKCFEYLGFLHTSCSVPLEIGLV